ncbi:MAG: type II toxin-antitoxin system HicA family toxin [Candidatus Wildermuthbacteria bacterium]|nr:type II toxin-antitoxin system HicA family toxin [Candidatus Wildermuthbacteria bacterium]
MPSALVTRARFYEYHQSGSHIQLRHLDNPGLRVTIPFHKKDLSPKTLKSIIKQAGISVEGFLNLL